MYINCRVDKKQIPAYRTRISTIIRTHTLTRSVWSTL